MSQEIVGRRRYGDARAFRDGVRERGLHYLMGVQGKHMVWPPGAKPHKPQRGPGQRGRSRTRYEAEGVAPWLISKLALQLPKEQFQVVHWREGSRGEQSSRFAAVRVRMAENHTKRTPPSEEIWLLVEWPDTQKAPTKYWLCSLPVQASLKDLVRFAKLRWRVERDYQEMKGEVGLDHFEGRTWRGFHHHATLCMVAHAFLALRRALFPPEQDALDPARSSSSPSAPPVASHRLLPALPAPRPLPRSAAGSVPHLTG
uniref:IS701 family transposase n=1 Tax=Citreicoccus inhibens TaxID=2849499 RepID=UPI002E295447|nr:transposase [Citreicoccus inhibens]